MPTIFRGYVGGKSLALLAQSYRKMTVGVSPDSQP